MMKQFRLAALLLCSTGSSGCYAISQGNATLVNNSAIQIIVPLGFVLAVAFVVIGVAVALTTEDKERRGAALGIAGTATAVFLFLVA